MGEGAGARGSLWRSAARAPSFAPLGQDLEVDVAVIGGGITGVTAAALLVKQGKSVALLEALEVGAGETGLTTAHLTEVLDVRYHALESSFGREAARQVALSKRTAIARIATFVEQEGLACDFAWVPGYLYAENAEGAAELKRELVSARHAGLAIEATRQVPLPFAVQLALRVEAQAQLHPVKYLAGLRERVATWGGLIFEHTRVRAVHDGRPCRVEVEGGHTVRAREVLVAAMVPVNNRFFLHTRQAAYRTYALAGRPEVVPPPGLYWDTAEPYHYIRTQSAPGGTYVVVGGEDHKTGQGEAAHARAKLVAYARDFLGIEQVEAVWSGQVVEPVDGLPFIGKNPGCSHVYVATGYSGNGMTFGTLAAMILSDHLLGGTSPFEALYSPRRRKPLAALKQLVAENLDYPAHLVADRLRPGEVKDVAAVRAGEGRIVRAHGRRLAAYRDEGGGLHLRSAVCTHMGCHVRWNSAEQSWDCPCHGGRFDPLGGVLTGPPRAPLASVAEQPAQRPRLALWGRRADLQPKPLSTKERNVDAIQLLKEQHEEVMDALEQYEQSDDVAEKRELFIEIADNFSAHASVEEKLFYPAVYVGEMKELLQEAVEEHLAAKRTIADLLELEPSDAQFDAKMKVLQEQIEHHVEEEEKVLFPKVRQSFSKDELEALGAEMEAMTEELEQTEPRHEIPRQIDQAPPLE